MSFLGLKFSGLSKRRVEENGIGESSESISFHLKFGGLASIRQTGKKITVWQRALPSVMSNFLNGLCLPMPRQHQFIWHSHEELTPQLDKAMANFSTSKCFGFRAWREDMLHLLQDCRELSPRQPIKVRLESVSSNGCRLFHTDQVALRLLCTYRGEGTLWIPEHAIDRTREDRTENAHVKDASAIESLGTGWVACLKGDAYPGEPDAGIFHRSPAAATDTPRILLAVDLY